MTLFRSCSVLGALALSLSALAGCSADASQPESDVEASDESALTQAGRALVGAYVDDGQNVHAGTIKALVLTGEAVGQQAKFFADVDTGIRCVRAPCPAQARIEGTFSAGTRTITLRSTSPHAGAFVGRYRYTLQGGSLTLTKDGKTRSLARELSYCALATDCEAQGLVVPACVGSFSCNANQCGFSCGMVDPCEGRDLNACQADTSCQPMFGPSWCSPSGMCSKDFAYKGCASKPPAAGTKCYSSDSCAADEYCTTEDGVCNSSGMLTVCSGTCETGARQR